MPPPIRARYDAQGNVIPEPRRMPRQMRPAEQRAVDPTPSVRRQAQEELASRPRFDAQGNPIVPNVPTPTAPSREIPARQANARPEEWADTGDFIRDTATNVGRWFSGDVGRDQEAGEIAWQSVPEQEDVRWEGGLLSGALNALPQGARTWLDAQGRANAIGVGFFLDPNEESRAHIIQRQVPTSQFRRDEYGNLQVRFDAEQPWAYINRPGWSNEDAVTLAGELEKYLLVRRAVPGGGANASGAVSPLGTSTLREVVTGAATMAGSQQLATVVGGDGADPVDVLIAGGGAGAGNVVGHGVGQTVRAVRASPEAVRRAVTWLSDRMPGGVQRAAERQAAAQTLIDGLEQAARRNAAEAVRTNAQALNLTGETLERAIREAEENAVQMVREQATGQASSLDTLARTFGVRLSKAQTEGDIGGMQFLYEAAGGLHGPAAQRAAGAFFAAQNRALPEGIRAIVPNPAGISTPEAGINVARSGAERAFGAARDAERAAWGNFDQAVQRVRTFEQTPVLLDEAGNAVGGGNPSGVYRVRNSIQDLLEQNRIFIIPRAETANAQGVADAMRQSYPLVYRAIQMIDNLAPATRDEVPLRDVERVVQIKRYIDDLWDSSADNPAQRRLLSQMGSTVRDWLRTEGARTLNERGALVTAGTLEEALGSSRELNRTFRDNRIIRSIVEPEPNVQPPTDEEIIRQVFGGGRGGLNVSSEGVGALRALRDALGPRSPEWESMRQAAVQRLTQGLDNAVETNQTPAIITTYNRISDAFRANREAMEVLFTPEELARLREAQQVLRAMMPIARNPANPTNSGITSGRATRGAMQALAGVLRNIPGANIAVGATADASAAARVNVEIAGAASDGFRIARAVGSLWDANRNLSGATGAAGSAYETMQSIPERGAQSGDPYAMPIVEGQRVPRAFERDLSNQQNGVALDIRSGPDGRFYVGERGFDTLPEAEAYARFVAARSGQTVGAP